MAVENKKLLEEKNIHLWFEGSPLMFCSMKLELNLTVGAMFAYAKFMNVQPERINSVVCDIICYDSVRREVDVIVGCTYNKLDIGRNMTFGSEISFRIAHPDTRNVEFVLRSVTTMSGAKWENTEKNRFNIDMEQENIFNVQKELHKQFISDCAKVDLDHTKLIFQPVFKEKYWLCGCGTLNWSEEEQCTVCGAGREWLRKNTDHDVLRKQLDEVEANAAIIRAEAEAAEEAEKEKEEEEFKKRSEKQKKELLSKEKKYYRHRVVTGVLVAILMFVAGFAAYKYGVPYVRYLIAVNELNHSEYDSAIEKFSKIDGFLDSNELMKKSIYGKATRVYNAGKMLEAAELYKRIEGFLDSTQKYIQSMKMAAERAEETGDYINAAELYRMLGNEAVDEYNICVKKIYSTATEKMAKSRYDEAYKSFRFLDKYKDSRELADECMYQLAAISYDDADYLTALERYESIKGYKDTDKILTKLSALKKILSAADEYGTPAVWNGSRIECPKCGDKVDYVFEFYGNGDFKFGVMCDKESDVLMMQGTFKIESGKIYRKTIKNNTAGWEEISRIVSLDVNNEDVEGKNTAMTLKNPFGKDNIKVYGNIMTDDTISIG